MKISNDVKTDIRSFVYFLFKGTLDQRLIAGNNDYFTLLLNNPEQLFNCFRIFASCMESGMSYSSEVSDYIIDILKKGKDNKPAESIIKSSLWKNFLEFSRAFCFNKFPERIENFDLNDFYGNGSDALYPFIIWTNNIEIDKSQNIINGSLAFERAFESLKFIFDGTKPSMPFSEEEVESEFY